MKVLKIGSVPLVRAQITVTHIFPMPSGETFDIQEHQQGKDRFQMIAPLAVAQQIKIGDMLDFLCVPCGTSEAYELLFVAKKNTKNSLKFVWAAGNHWKLIWSQMVP